MEYVEHEGRREPRYSNAEVYAIADNEGWGYMVQHYMPARYCADPATEALFEAARLSMNAFREHLSPYEAEALALED